MFRKHGKHFLLYGLVGIVAMLVDFLCLYTLTEVFHYYYLYSLVGAYFVAALVNYSLQKKVTFKCKKNNYCRQFLQFFLVGLVGLLINMVIVYAGTEYFGLWYIYGKVIATFVAFLWNFTMNKFFTFTPVVL